MSTYNDFLKVHKEVKYKFVSLQDQNGQKIVPYNQNGKDPAIKLQEIERRLKAPGSGTYVICAKMSVKGKEDHYLITNGDQLSEPAPVIIHQSAPPVNNAEVLTYESALNLRVENERLKLENAALLAEIEQLNETLSEIESEQSENLAESGKMSLIENAKTFLTESLSIVAPLLDKHFDLKEKQLALKALELDRMASKPAAIQKPEERKRNEKSKVEQYIMTCKNEPELFNELAAVYNNAESENDFFETLAQVNQDQYIKLLQWINNN
jgi:hypothetical protein